MLELQVRVRCCGYSAQCAAVIASQRVCSVFTLAAAHPLLLPFFFFLLLRSFFFFCVLFLNMIFLFSRVGLILSLSFSHSACLFLLCPYALPHLPLPFSLPFFSYTLFLSLLTLWQEKLSAAEAQRADLETRLSRAQSAPVTSPLRCAPRLAAADSLQTLPGRPVFISLLSLLCNPPNLLLSLTLPSCLRLSSALDGALSRLAGNGPGGRLSALGQRQQQQQCRRKAAVRRTQARQAWTAIPTPTTTILRTMTMTLRMAILATAS